MAGRSRVLGFERAFGPSALACLALGTGACIVTSAHPDPVPEAPSAQGGSVSSGGFGAAGVALGLAAGGSIQIIEVGDHHCSLPSIGGKAVFASQVFDGSRPARREFFSWTTDEQVAALRQDQVLFSRSERPGLGPGYAFQVFAQLARDETLGEQAQLAKLLGGELFAKVRYAWSEPWATRMGWPGEDYGDNLLRIVLKPEAWLVLVKEGGLSVVDLQNDPVALSVVLANPGRIGAIYYQKDRSTGGPFCGGSFASGGSGYREFILGNLAMVEEWSIGTEQIRDRLSANIASLSAFLERVRACPVTSSAQQWTVDVVCNWDIVGGELTELSAYEQSLAIPSDNYLAVPERIATMIETLQGDLFELDPLLVTPGKP